MTDWIDGRFRAMITDTPGLTTNRRRVIYALARRGCVNNRHVQVSVEDLARDVSMSRANVGQIVRALQQMGYIHVGRRVDRKGRPATPVFRVDWCAMQSAGCRMRQRVTV